MADGKLKIKRGSGKGKPGVPELLFCGSESEVGPEEGDWQAPRSL